MYGSLYNLSLLQKFLNLFYMLSWTCTTLLIHLPFTTSVPSFSSPDVSTSPLWRISSLSPFTLPTPVSNWSVHVPLLFVEGYVVVLVPDTTLSPPPYSTVAKKVVYSCKPKEIPLLWQYIVVYHLSLMNERVSDLIPYRVPTRSGRVLERTVTWHVLHHLYPYPYKL